MVFGYSTFAFVWIIMVPMWLTCLLLTRPSLLQMVPPFFLHVPSTYSSGVLVPPRWILVYNCVLILLDIGHILSAGTLVYISSFHVYR